MGRKKMKMMKQEIKSLHKARKELLQLYVDLLKERDELRHRMEFMLRDEFFPL